MYVLYCIDKEVLSTFETIMYIFIKCIDNIICMEYFNYFEFQVHNILINNDLQCISYTYNSDLIKYNN